MERKAQHDHLLYSWAQKATVTDPTHARAVVGGILGEAVRMAKTTAEVKGQNFDNGPWRGAYYCAMDEIDETDRPMKECLRNVQGKLNAQRLFAEKSDNSGMGPNSRKASRSLSPSSTCKPNVWKTV
jgi:hypothetical protein